MNDLIAPPSLITCRMATVLSVLEEKVTQVKRPNLNVTHPKSAYGRAAEFLTNRPMSTQEERDYLCRLWATHMRGTSRESLEGLPRSTPNFTPTPPRLPPRKFLIPTELEPKGLGSCSTIKVATPQLQPLLRKEVGIQCNWQEITRGNVTDPPSGNLQVQLDSKQANYECPYWNWQLIYCRHCGMPLCVNGQGQIVL